jgi:polyribonucleotide nucleotidyltransferase
MHSETMTLNGQQVTLETGSIARQASGAVVLTAGDTVLLATVSCAKKPSHLPFMPLTCEWRNRYAAAGRIPGSRDRREARANELETLASRLVDRSVRPLFPEHWRYDTQVMVQPLSYDGEADVATLAITGASAALSVSDIPWQGPTAGVRVCQSGGELVAFPTAAQRAECSLDLLITCNRDGIVMIEGGGDEVAEDVVLEAFSLAQRAAQPILAALDGLKAKAAPSERPVPEAVRHPDVEARVAEAGREPLLEALQVSGKHERYKALDDAQERILEALGLGEETPDVAQRGVAKECVQGLKKTLIREGILAGKRLGGRAPDEIRQITGRAGWLPRCHGSSLFTRGETQAIMTCTLGRERDAQPIETLDGHHSQAFLLHYNFPPFCVNEVKPIRGPARREIGHGHLARRALAPLIPPAEKAPYTIRLESTITESNGSSSMATICSGSMALMDAGLPIERPVAGIAMGLVKEGEQVVVLSDILGDEDHVGDMDFKVGGTEAGVTAIQLDNKIGAVPEEVMQQALQQARAGRLHIIGEMAKVIAVPRAEMNPHAPRVATVQIQPNRIGDLIGPGGKHIKGLQADTNTQIDVGDEGLVRIFAQTAVELAEAKARVVDLTGVPEIGREYEARCVSVKDFGSFVRLFQGIDGLLHGVTLTEGEQLKVRVSGVNDRGKLVLERV